AQPPLEILQLGKWSGGVGFHASVRKIADPSVELQIPCGPLREIAVSHSLNPPGDQVFSRVPDHSSAILPRSGREGPAPTVLFPLSRSCRLPEPCYDSVKSEEFGGICAREAGVCVPSEHRGNGLYASCPGAAKRAGRHRYPVGRMVDSGTPAGRATPLGSGIPRLKRRHHCGIISVCDSREANGSAT